MADFFSPSFSYTMRKQTFGLLKFNLHCFLPCNNFYIHSLVATGSALVSKHNVPAADPNPCLVCLQSRLGRRLTAAAWANKAKYGRGGRGEKTREFNLDILKVRVRGAVHVYKGEGLWVFTRVVSVCESWEVVKARWTAFKGLSKSRSAAVVRVTSIKNSLEAIGYRRLAENQFLTVMDCLSDRK